MASPEETVALTPKSARVRHSSRLANRAFRAKQREFLAEGPQAVREALGRAGTVVEVFASEAATQRYGDLRASAAAAGSDWHVVDEAVVSAICDTVHPQGMVARCRFVDVPLEQVLARDLRLIVVCADVRDPGNAGTIIRCADAAGADAVILAGHSVDPFNPKAVRASVGSVFHLDVVTDSATADVVAALRDRGIRILAADSTGPTDLFSADLRAPSAWIMGNEAHGLEQPIRELADDVIAVPIYGKAESLNLATAAALCLYASARAQRAD